jgi:predicted membrane chloride channel (bestrophin family)
VEPDIFDELHYFTETNTAFVAYDMLFLEKISNNLVLPI